MGKGVDTAVWSPPGGGPEEPLFGWTVLPVAMFWFGFLFFSKEFELGGRKRRESEETRAQRFRSLGVEKVGPEDGVLCPLFTV